MWEAWLLLGFWNCSQDFRVARVLECFQDFGVAPRVLECSQDFGVKCEKELVFVTISDFLTVIYLVKIRFSI